jgi:membrane-bound inhibitor of C-type lysozyme
MFTPAASHEVALANLGAALADGRFVAWTKGHSHKRAKFNFRRNDSNRILITFDISIE